MAQPFRIVPVIGPEYYTTYSISAPVSTHFRRATCAEVECDAYRLGWSSTIDVTRVLIDPVTGQPSGLTGTDQADYIRTNSGRRFTERWISVTEVVFDFFPGQEGFAGDQHTHYLPLDRPEVYTVRGGDYRGNPRGEGRRFDRADQFVEDFAEHQDALRTAIERG